MLNYVRRNYQYIKDILDIIKIIYIIISKKNNKKNSIKDQFLSYVYFFLYCNLSIIALQDLFYFLHYYI